MQPSAQMEPTADAVPAVFLRLPKVVQITGIGRSSIYRLMQARQFPRPCRISRRVVAWRKADIEAWAETRPLSVE